MMKQVAFKSIVVASLVLMASACASIPAQPDWKFIQSNGGLSVGDLTLVDGIYYLPVNMDVSRYAKGKMVCTKSSARVAGKQILLRIKADSKKNAPRASGKCPDAKIGGIPDGNYRVMFVGPNGESKKLADVTANLAGI